jgi:hypothetical protein
MNIMITRTMIGRNLDGTTYEIEREDTRVRDTIWAIAVAIVWISIMKIGLYGF